MKAVSWVLFIGLLVLGSRPAGAAQGGGYTLAGLVGQYYANTNLAGSPSFTRRDVRLDFGLNHLPPGGAGQVGDLAFRSVPTSGFAVQWTGQLIPRFAEAYTFAVLARDAFILRLRPAGGSTWTTVIAQTSYAGTESTGVITLVAGLAYDVQAILIHGDGAWAAQLRWSSPSTPDEVIDPLVNTGTMDPDWTAGFTDIVKGAGRNTWQGLTPGGSPWGAAPQDLDALGWPTADGGYIFQESLTEGLGLDPLMRGLITFAFQGSATVSLYGNVVNSSLSYRYDPSQNLTTGTFMTTDNGANASAFAFANSSRNGQPNGPPGITDLRLMRPTAPDASTSYKSTTSLFTPQMLEALSHFTVVRHYYVANQQRDWSERTPPAYFNQNLGTVSAAHYGVGPPSNNGASWEHKILLANETGRDLMLSLPTVASGSGPADTTSYIYNLANLLCYGSDGVEPYTAPTSNPVYPPLNANLRVYLELGDELWNWGNPYYVDFNNVNTLAAADVASNDADFQAFNFDGLSTATDANGNYLSMNTWRYRKIMLRLMHISDIFRSVFGDAAMMTHIRPLYEWMYANDGDTAGLALTFADRYFNNGDGQAHVADPLPVSHWLWGGGGATYYGAVNGNGLTTLISNPSFSLPSLAQPGYQVAPSGSPWTFSGTAGIACYGGSATDIPPPYQGSQMAFITDDGAVSIPVTFPTNFISPIFGVSFKAVNRTKAGAANPDNESLRVYLDGTNDITARTFIQWTGYTIPAAYDPANPWLALNVSWTLSDYYYTRAFTVQPGGTHTITIRGFGDWSNPANTNQTAFLGEVRITSVDRIFEDGMPGGGEATGQPVGEVYQDTLNVEATWAKAFGLEELSYEGGWSLGGDDGGSWVQNEAKYGDARTASVQEHSMDMFHFAGSAVSVLGSYELWPNWGDYYAQQGLLDIARYPIVQGVDDRASQLPAEPDNGVLLPGILAPFTASISDSANASLGQITAAGGWINWNVIAPVSGQYQATLIPLGATNNAAVLLVDDAPVASAGQWTGTFPLTKGLHSVKVRSTSASVFQVTQIILSAVGAPASPTNWSVVAGDGQATLNWAPVAGATDYVVRFGPASGTYTEAMDAGVATNLTVQGLTNNQEYFFVVQAGNAAGPSLPSAGQGVIPLSPGQTGSLAVWDFDGAVGDEVTASPVAVAGQLTVGALSRGAGLDPSESDWGALLRANRFASEPDASVNHDYGTNLAQAVAMNQYYQFTLQPAPGQTLSLSELGFLAYFQNDDVAMGAGITYSTNGVTFSDGLLATGSSTNISVPWTVDLTGEASLQNTTASLTFRIYLFRTCGYCVSGLGDPSGPGLVVTGSLEPVLPTLVNQPASQTVAEGANVMLIVTAAGASPLSYQWLLNGTALTDYGRITGSQSNLLAIANVSLGDAGNYVVVVTNGYGSATSAVAALTVLPPMPLVTWTNPGPIIYGTPLRSSQLDAAANVPGNFAYSPTNGTVLDAGTNMLSVLFTPTDTVDYSSAAGSVSLVVSPAYLTVTAANASRAYGQANPVFTGTVTGVTNGDNITATYGCSATTSSPPGTYLIVPSLVDPNGRAGNYAVTAINGAMTVTGTTVAPAILTQPQSQVALAGSNVVFSVSALGEQPLYYQWQSNGVNLADAGNIRGSTNASLMISNVLWSNSGTYSVVVSNALGSVTSAGALLSVVLPGNLVQNGGFESGSFNGWVLSGNFGDATVSTSSLDAHSGQYGAALGPGGSLGYLSQTLPTVPGQPYLVSFWLDSQGGDPSEFLVTWDGDTLFDQVALGASGWTNMQFTAFATATNTTLTFGFRNDPSYFGLDDVSVQPLASGSNAPVIVAQPLNQTLPHGVTAQFSVLAVGTPPLSYQWWFDNVSLTGATNATLVLNNVQTNNGGDYFVVITNAYGSVTSSVANLLVSNAPWEPGFAKVEWWYTNNPAEVNNLAALESGSLGPAQVVVAAPQVGARENNVGPAWDNGRITCWFVPPASGAYSFYVCSDDQADLFLSTDSNPANTRMIAQETAWSGPLRWVSSDGGSSIAQKCSNGFIPPGAPAGTAPPYATGVSLTAGSSYYLELDHWNEWGGDNCEATVTPTGSPPTDGDAPTLTGSYIRFCFPRCSYVAFTNQPVSVTNAAPFKPVTFTAGGITDSQVGIMGENDPAAGTNNFMLFQWTTNGIAVPGANSSSFTVVADPLLNNAQIACQMRALGYADAAGTPIWSNSTVAVLTVAPTVPAISYASVFQQNGGNPVLDIRFNELMNPASLLNATYTVPGCTVGAMNVFTNGSKNLSPTSEALTLDQYASIQMVVNGSLTFPLTLTVSGAKDAWGSVLLTATATIVEQGQLVDADVGTPSAHDPAVPGVVWVNGPGNYTIQCEGSDIWGGADGFNFAYQRVSGDFNVVVRVKDTTHTSNWSKAGLMVRETLDAGSRNWNIVCDPDSSDGIAAPDGSGNGANEIECNCRNTTGGGSAPWQVVTNGMAPAYPNAWVRLQRVGTTLAAYYSTNGTDWVQHAWDDPTTVGARTALPAIVYIGICQTAHNNDPTPTPPFNQLAFLDTVDYDSFNVAFAPAAPAIVTQPVSQIVTQGVNVTFNVAAIGTPPLSYQWLFNGTNLTDNAQITGSQNNILALTGVTMLNSGTYQVVVTNAYGATNSPPVVLTVITPSPAQVVNAAASSVAGNSATLSGRVLSTGGSTPVVTIFYGAKDGGTTASAWAQSVSVGSQSGAFSAVVGGLAQKTTYYFTCQASNTFGVSWASPSLNFTTVFGAPLVLTNSYINSFPTFGLTYPSTGGSVGSWVYDYGVYVDPPPRGVGLTNDYYIPMTNDPTMDAEGQTNTSGSLLVVSPFGTASDQNVFSGTFDPENLAVMPLNIITNLAFDIHVAPGTEPNFAGNFGTITMSLTDPLAGVGGSFAFFTPITIPGSASNGWVHLTDTNVVADLANYMAAGCANASGVGFDYNSFNGGYPTNTVTFWIDNVTVATSWAAPPPPVFNPSNGLSASAMAVGQNLEEVVDWSASWPFVDVFKKARTWITGNLDGSGPWDTGFETLIPVDTNGWPTHVPFAANGTAQLVRTIITRLNEAGTYDFIYEGTGALYLELDFPGGSQAWHTNLTATGGVQSWPFDATSTNSQVILEILSSASNDYLRNFHLVLTNFLATYATQPFHPLFLQRLQPFGCLRFVWWEEAPDSTLVSWTNRTTPSYYTQATYNTQTKPDGVALEYMVQLCNTLQENAWICIPAAADDNYIQQAAQLFYNSLNPNLRVYVEYANETWNGGYFGAAYVETQGLKFSLDPAPFKAGEYYVARRSGQIWNIFQQVFGSAASSRLVKVMATQSGNYGVTYDRAAGLLDASVNVTGVLPDALAIAPYFSGGVTGATTVDDILTKLAPQAIAEVETNVGVEKGIADGYGWWLVCYEGGQSFLGSDGAAQNDTNVTAICEAANRDPRMGTLYTEYLDMLKAQGVNLFNNFSYCGNWSQYGCFGSLEYQDQPTNAAPKYAALVQWITAPNGAPIPTAPTVSPSSTVYAGATVTLSERAFGSPPFQYQWLSNSVPLPGATGSTLVLTNVAVADSATYQVIVTDRYGSSNSPALVLTVKPLTAPLFTSEPAPASATGHVSGTVTFSASVDGTPPISLQWQLNGTNVAGQTGSNLSLTDLQTNQAGTYTLVASNAYGLATSTPVALVVLALPSFNPSNGLLSNAMAVGQNLEEVVDWSASWPFVDVFKKARTWITGNLDGSGPWDTGFETVIPVDTNGWPTRVPFAANGTNQLVRTIITALNEAGTYDFIYEGTGTLHFELNFPDGSQDWYTNLTATGGVQSCSFAAISTNSQVILEILSSASNDYLRNFHLVLTNYLGTYATQPFHPLFLQRLQPFGCLRFVWWEEAPDSTLVSWTNRTTPSYYTQATYNTQTKPDGVALEYMVQLCNTLQENAWICIPAAADDDYVQHAAQLFYNSLNPNLRVYVEYANERWNGGYFGCTYAETQGLKLSLDPNASRAGSYYVARRSGQIWNIFQQVFGSAASSRLVKVIATQSGNYGVTYDRAAGLLDASVNVTGVLPDALAIAPYFGWYVAATNTVDDILTNLAPQAIAGVETNVSVEKGIADSYGWWLVCYEGGQSFLGSNGQEQDTVEAANHDPRMGTLYTEYLDMLKAQGVNLFNNFSYCGNWSQYGCFGSLEYQDQPTNAAPKYDALVQWMGANPGPAPATTLLFLNPTPIIYGTALSSNQLNATANVPGSFAYNPTNGAVLNAGTNALSVVFTPTDTVDYSSATGSVNLVVLPAPLTVTAANTNRVYGAANPVFTGAVTGVTNDDNITATYGCSATTSSPAGTYPIVPSLLDPNNRQTNYTVRLVNGTLTVGQVTAVITWTNPAPIIYGTALNSNQLNATANVPGSFAYNPTNGIVLNTGTNRLSVIFTPTDTVDYSSATDTVSLNVEKADQTITFAPLTNALAGVPFPLTATASSGLSVSFALLSGPATLSGNVITATNAGTVVIQASQAGNTNYNAAPVVTQSVSMTTGPAPFLQITLLSDRITVSWPASAYGFIMQTRNDLTSNLPWTAVTNGLETNGAVISIRINVASLAAFYRLAFPAAP